MFLAEISVLKVFIMEATEIFLWLDLKDCRKRHVFLWRRQIGELRINPELKEF